MLTIRYPSGVTEFRSGQQLPQVGEALVGNGGSWLVEAVDEALDGSMVVTLASTPAPQPSEPR